jgi:Leucine-rich repeat (LRR) protein
VIGSLSQLGSLYLSSNQLTGSLPSEIGSLSELGIFYLDNNQLTGTIPITFGALSELSVLSLPRNQFTGTIPSQLSSLSELSALYLHKNQFTGMIPSAIACLSQLDVLSLYDNHLTGTIPSEIASSSQLSTLYLYNNYLTGTISPNIGCLFRLVSLSLHNNQLTGPIPLEIGFLSQLVLLYLHLNQLTGSIPSEIGSLSQLSSLYLDNNLFTGTIPSEIGSFLQLETISLFNNQFTGTLPLSISRLRNLTWLHAYDNRLSGQITFPLALLPKLEQLFLHRNHFTGHLNHLFRFSPDSPWNVSSSELLNLDVSDNLFSGSIPSTLFLPHLQSISLSLNCFEHELPSSICEASDAGVISMDGLGSAKGCKSVVTVPFTSVSLVQSLDGNIPDCVWSMSNLKMLNLAGNGLRGRIGAAASMSSLLSLTLSHNYLSGEIPLWLQTKNLSHLDLSHNKLTGDANGFRHQNVLDSSNSWNSDLVNASLGSQYLNRSLALTVNRLSGDLPDSFGKYSDLDILSGNLFGCGNLPKNDENSDSVSCGSEEYDQTLQLMGGVLGSIVCGVVLLYLLRFLIPSLISRDEKNDSKDHRFASVRSSPVHSIILRYLNYDQSISSSSPHSTEEINTLSPSHPLPSTISFGNLLSRLIRSVCVLAMLCLLSTLPIYVLKQWDPQYVTHSHMYNWLWTMAFVSGATPAIIFLCMCLVTLFYFVFVVNRLGAVTDIKEPHSSSSSVTDNYPHHFHPFTIWIIFVLNVVVVGTVNGLYLWSTLSTILICAVILLSSSHSITEHPHWSWLLNWFPGVCWPSHWNNFHHDQHTSELTVNQKPIRLVNPHEIISRMMNNFVFLLSFGVCSPVLCCYIALSICVHLSCWLILIGRFVCLRIDALAAGSGSLPTPGLSLPLFFIDRSQENYRRSTLASVGPATQWCPLCSPGLQMADHPDVLFLRDSVVLGYGWRPRRLVQRLVGSDRGSCDGNVDLGLGSCLDL